jgi:hypothetical protein
LIVFALFFFVLCALCCQFLSYVTATLIGCRQYIDLKYINIGIPQQYTMSVLKYTSEGQSKLNNPEKLATQGTQDKEKQSKNNPEKLATQGTQDEEKHSKNTVRYVYILG